VNLTRECGACSLCCTVLRVDELRKLGGTACVHQRAGGGCGIYQQRPGICRAYRCLWLGGGLRDEDRPDALGAVLDLVAQGGSVWLEIREARPGAFERSARLRELAQEYRASMPVRIGDTADVLDPERRFRVLLPDGEERIVSGEWTTIVRPGRPDSRVRLPWLERWIRRLSLALRRRRVATYRGAR
jgi:Fe-S-cluster containining protein